MTDNDLGFLGRSKVAEAVRRHDWKASGLGSPAEWSPELRAAVALCLRSEAIAAVYWGPDRRIIYNDQTIDILGERHPAALGAPASELWTQTWANLGPMMERIFRDGREIHGSNTRFALDSMGHPHEAYYNYSFTPIVDERGNVAGIYGVGRETTPLVMAERFELLNRTGVVIAAETDLEKVVQAVTDAGVKLSGAQFGAFFYNVTNVQGESCMLYSLSGAPREAFSAFPMPRATAIFKPTFDGDGIVRSDDILADQRYGGSAPYHGMPAGHLPVRSYLAVPVKSRNGEVLGGLFFGHAEPAQFTTEHERLLTGISAQAAVAIDNARLFQALQRENKARAEAEQRLTQLNQGLESQVAEETASRKLTEAALAQAQKMESIGQLTGGIAHDFNNLLQVVGGNLQLLAKDVAGNARGEQRIANAMAGVSRGAKVASQLLAFGRRQALEPRAVNVGRLIAGMDEMLRRTLGETVEVETITAGGLWNCFVDPSQIENAMLNLAINARDAMPAGGKLTIEAGNAYIDDTYSRTHAEATPGQYVAIAVSDTGTGMPVDVMEKAFEPFFSTKEEGKGSGLGLSMVYGLVRQSGGHVRLYSEEGHGTTVRLYLPRAMKDEDRMVERPAGPVVGGTETILVAEDDEGVRETAIEMLIELGYHVLRAKDPASALTVIESGVPIDLLFTDVVMPGTIKAPELARLAKQRLPGLRVLFTSGYTENSIVHGGRLDAGVDLLPKPYAREALAHKIRLVLDSERGETSPPQIVGRSENRPADNAVVAPALRVLLVEDEMLIRMSSADMLASVGHHALEAGDASEALQVLAGADVDVLVTDLSLPAMDGLQLAAAARERWPGLGVVYATGRARGIDDVTTPGSVWLMKPYDAAALDKAIRVASSWRQAATKCPPMT